MMYNKLLEECFFSLSHSGTLDDSKRNTVRYRSQLSGAGGTIELSLQCTDCGLISQARFRAQGNPYLLAALEWLCRQMEGEPLSLHPRIDYQQLVEVLDIPNTQYPIAIRIEDIYRETVSRMQKKLNEVKP